jgi:hypothetical protein
LYGSLLDLNYSTRAAKDSKSSILTLTSISMKHALYIFVYKQNLSYGDLIIYLEQFKHILNVICKCELYFMFLQIFDEQILHYFIVLVYQHLWQQLWTLQELLIHFRHWYTLIKVHLALVGAFESWMRSSHCRISNVSINLLCCDRYHYWKDTAFI